MGHTDPPSGFPIGTMNPTVTVCDTEVRASVAAANAGADGKRHENRTAAGLRNVATTSLDDSLFIFHVGVSSLKESSQAMIVDLFSDSRVSNGIDQRLPCPLVFNLVLAFGFYRSQHLPARA